MYSSEDTPFWSRGWSIACTAWNEAGLARAMAAASAASIVFFTGAGPFYGERLNVFHFGAALLACCAVFPQKEL